MTRSAWTGDDQPDTPDGTPDEPVNADAPTDTVVLVATNTDRFIVPAGPDGDRLDITRDGDPVPAARVEQVLQAAARSGVTLTTR